jgi:hypothetical protein
MIIRNQDSKSAHSSTPSPQTTKASGELRRKHFVYKIVASNGSIGCKQIVKNVTYSQK